MENYDLEAILDMYDDDYVREPRPMMAGGGQLVQPSVDGSRPGYNGRGRPRIYANEAERYVASKEGKKIKEAQEIGKVYDRKTKRFREPKINPQEILRKKTTKQIINKVQILYLQN